MWRLRAVHKSRTPYLLDKLTSAPNTEIADELLDVMASPGKDGMAIQKQRVLRTGLSLPVEVWDARGV